MGQADQVRFGRKETFFQPRAIMGMKSIFDVIGKERADELMSQAFHKAVADLHAAGLPSVGLIDGVVSMRWPDGRVVPVTQESRDELEEVQRRRAALNPE